MKARVISFLNLRTGTPEVLPNNNPGDIFFSPGDVVDIAETVTGENHQGNNVWFRLADGGFIWSGGVEKISAVAIRFNSYKEQNPDLINWNNSIKQIPLNWLKSRGKGVKIAVMDTGIFDKHEDLNNSISTYIDFTKIKDNIDHIGHGTHVAGIIGARSETVNGVIGVAPDCDLIILKVIYDGNDGAIENYQHIIDALEIAKNQGADVINMSLSLRLGLTDDESKKLKVDEVRKKIQELANENIIVVAAGGDKGDLKEGKLFFPAECHEVISVAAITHGHFERNPVVSKELNIVGPFIDYLSAFKGPVFYERKGGCSMTTAFISGILALAISANRANINQRFNKSELLAMLKQHSLSLDDIEYKNASSFCYHLLND